MADRWGTEMREEIWPALVRFADELRAEGLWSHKTICVEAARVLDEAVAALAGSGIRAVSLAKRAAKDGEVAVATMHRMKGLEFRCVAVVGRRRVRFLVDELLGRE